MWTTLFDYATVAAPIGRKGWVMGELGGMGLAHVLVLEEPGTESRLTHPLGNAGFACETVSSINAALAVVETRGADVLICVTGTSGGAELVRIMRSRKPDLPLILLTDEPNVAMAVAAIRQGAFDYLARPLRDEALIAAVQRALEFGNLRHENRRLRQQLDVASTAAGFVGESAASKQLAALIRRVAPARSTVLIEGESGTGKELAARMLHYWSKRADGPFIPINCKAIANGVMESELFGHEKGSFTGAIAGRPGCFERASGGTLFLDEVGEAGADFQSKLLRVLEDGEVLRVGASRPRKIDVRLVAATNRLLRHEVAAGHFRPDLYYRLNVIPIRMVPLRERPGDILPLARHFLAYHAAEAGRTLRMAPETEQALLGHSWPGNVRELENVIERAVVISGAEVLTVDALALELPPGETGTSLVQAKEPDRTDSKETLQECLDGAARSKIRQALDRAEGNRAEAATLLGVDRTTLYRLMKRLGIG